MNVELFSGTWVFNPSESQLSTPPPPHWIQRIHAADGRLQVSEEIIRADGSTMRVSVEAVPDGKFYPVNGSPAADTIAYTVEDAIIMGVGRKNGADSLRERLVFSPSGKMTMTYSVLMNSTEVASGMAVFDKVS